MIDVIDTGPDVEAERTETRLERAVGGDFTGKLEIGGVRVFVEMHG